jgi:hypothetical protein
MTSTFPVRETLTPSFRAKRFGLRQRQLPLLNRDEKRWLRHRTPKRLRHEKLRNDQHLPTAKR